MNGGDRILLYFADYWDDMWRRRQQLAWRLAPLLFAKGFVVRIGTELTCSDAEELEHTRTALEAAGSVRSQIIRAMAPAARSVAARRLYCFCRRVEPGETVDRSRVGRVQVDILLTKPHVVHLDRKGVEDDAQPSAQ